MFSLTDFLKDSFLGQHIEKPISLEGISHVENLSDKYDLIVRYRVTVEVATKRGEK